MEDHRRAFRFPDKAAPNSVHPVDLDRAFPSRPWMWQLSARCLESVGNALFFRVGLV
jgi:hypothetical protein